MVQEYWVFLENRQTLWMLGSLALIAWPCQASCHCLSGDNLVQVGRGNGCRVEILVGRVGGLQQGFLIGKGN